MKYLKDSKFNIGKSNILFKVVIGIIITIIIILMVNMVMVNRENSITILDSLGNE